MNEDLLENIFYGALLVTFLIFIIGLASIPICCLINSKMNIDKEIKIKAMELNYNYVEDK